MADILINIPVKITGGDKVEVLGQQIQGAGDKAKKTTEQLSGLESGLGSLKGILAGLGAGAAFSFMDQALKAQAESVAAINSLNLELANQAHYTDEVSKSLVDYAAALQDVTTFDDEAIVRAEAMAASFGMNEKQIKETTKTALDFATATGRDLKEAIEILGKAYLGHTGQLGKLGITVDETKSRTEKYAQVIDQLNSRFGGAATAAAQNYAGGLAQLKNAANDAEEGIGKFLGELLGSDKPFSIAIDGARTVARFFSVDMVIALSEFRARWLETLADLRSFKPKTFLAEMASGQGFAVSAALAMGGPDDPFAAALREQAKQLRAEGDAAAAAAGHTQTFANATHVAKLGVDDLSKTLEKYNKDVQAEFNRLAGGAGVDLRSTEQVADDIQKALDKAPVRNLQLTPPVKVKPVFHFDPGSLTGFKDSLTKALNNLPQVILGAIQGGGKVGEAIGASIMGSIFGKDTKLVDQMTGWLQHIFGDTFGKALGAVLPGVGTLIGKGLGGLVDKLFGGLFGGGDAKKRAEQAARDAKEALDMKPIQDEFNQLVVAAQRAGIQFDHTFDTHNADALKASIDEIKKALDLNAQANQALDDAMQRYGITIEQLGPKFAQQKLDEQAGQLIQDYNILKAAGVDVAVITEKMGSNFSDYVNTAKRAGAEIPESMKPILQDLIDHGKLLDENGNAYTSLQDVGVTFAQTMSQQFESLMQKITDLVNALLGIPNVTRTVNIVTNGPTPNGPDPNDPGTYMMAAGGTVYATPGGVHKILGEGGENEDVVPWSKRAAYARAHGGSNGDSYHVGEIHVHGVQDPEQFAKTYKQVIRNNVGGAASATARVVARY